MEISNKQVLEVLKKNTLQKKRVKAIALLELENRKLGGIIVNDWNKKLSSKI